MKRFILLLAFVLSCQYCVASNYSNAAIIIYNQGVALHKQGKYELAEQKYNQALKIQPNFVEAKKNLSYIYQNLARIQYGKSDFDKSIYYAHKSLTFSPNNADCYNTLANCYLSQNNNEKLIETYKKMLAITPDDDLVMSSLASAYTKTNQNEKAEELYRKILTINPNDKMAQQNLKYVNYKKDDESVNKSINNLNVGHIAPEELYNLIKPPMGVDYYYVEKMKTILDLIWSEPNGNTMLTTLMKNKTSIVLTPDQDIKANALREKQTRTIYAYGIIPIATFTTKTKVTVNIPISHIQNFNNPNLPANQRVYNLHVFIHEFGHAYIGLKNSNDVNSMEEEIGVSMVGYNIANRIITGKYLSQEQTEKYSLECLQAILSDEHRNLPIYSGFNNEIQKYGIMLPYPYIYSNIPSMYKKLLSEGKTSPNTKFNAY